MYFIKYCNNNYLGDTKLNKLFYYLDFINYRDEKKTVTGDFYIHNHYGPTPNGLKNILFEMVENKEIEILRNPFEKGFSTSFVLKKKLDESVFTKQEKKLLKSISKEFLDWSTDKIVEQTHLEAPWFYSKPFERVDYEYSSDIEFFEK